MCSSFIKNNYNQRLNILIFLLSIFYSFALISGPALSDIVITLTAIAYLSYIVYLKNYNITESRYLIFALAFYLYAVFLSLISNNPINSLESSLPYIRFLVFIFAFIFLLEKKILNIKIFLLFLSIYSFLICIDINLQFFFDREIFGNEKTMDGLRLTGPYKDEPIVGSIISRISLMVLFLYFNIYSKNKIDEIIFGSLLIFFIFSIFITGERMSFFSSILNVILCLFFLKKYKSIILYFIIFVIIFNLLLLNESRLLYRMFDQFLYQLGILEHHFFSFSKSGWFLHFKTAYLLSLYNYFWGIGLNNFQLNCQNISYLVEIDSGGNKIYRDGCSTHPHNYYLEWLVELGLIGLLFFIGFIVATFYTSIKKLSDFSLLNKNNLIIVLVNFFTLNWPIMSTGSFFHNWNSVIYWFTFALICYFNKISLKNKNE